MAGTSSSTTIQTKLLRIAQLANERPQMAFTTLAHHIDMEWLKEAYRRTRKDGAVGVDGQTAWEYAADLEGNLKRLLDRAKSGTYRAPPVRRVHIPKGEGKETRPIGIPAFEDKVLQRAVVMVLEPIYERDFLPCSYGFRPGRSAHQALDALWKTTMDMRGGWILEIDIKKFFDTLDHAHLRAIVRQRIRDGVLLRLIGKWLKAGVLEQGTLSYPETGSPQGGVISPVLSNAYLHEVLDRWFEGTVKPRLQGRATLIRYADDAVIAFAKEGDARRVMDVLRQRFARYGLTLHPEKTRLVRFNRPQEAQKSEEDENTPPGTFDFLGFTHYWGASNRGAWIPKRKTAQARLTRALRKVKQWCRDHRHDPVREQWQQLRRKVAGHCGYYGVIGNARQLSRFVHEVQRTWKKWLSRRSNTTNFTWERFGLLLSRYPLSVPTRSRAT